jgi:hypothetical protein
MWKTVGKRSAPDLVTARVQDAAPEDISLDTPDGMRMQLVPPECAGERRWITA